MDRIGFCPSLSYLSPAQGLAPTSAETSVPLQVSASEDMLSREGKQEVEGGRSTQVQLADPRII